MFCESLIAIETFFRTLNVNMENSVSGSGKIVKILQRLWRKIHGWNACTADRIRKFKRKYKELKSQWEDYDSRFLQWNGYSRTDYWYCYGMVSANDRLLHHYQLCQFGVPRVKYNIRSTCVVHCHSSGTDFRWPNIDFVKWFTWTENHFNNLIAWLGHRLIHFIVLFISQSKWFRFIELFNFTGRLSVVCHMYIVCRHCTALECLCRWKFAAKGIQTIQLILI